jgi:hypothetical protein
LPPRDCAYLAGLFDGEGCMSASVKSSGGRRLTFTLIWMVINTNVPVLQWCKKTVGAGHVVEAKSTKKHKRRLRCFRFIVDGHQEMLPLLLQLRPYLRIKSTQVTAAVSFLRSRARRPFRSPYSPAELGALFDIRAANRKAYEQRDVIIIRKKKYTRAEFLAFVLEGYYKKAERQMVEWTPKMDALLGTDSDGRLAARLGLKLAQVQRRRAGLGLPAWRKTC